MMLELCVSDYCHNCPEFYPVSETTEIHADNAVANYITQVKCLHEDACRRKVEFLERFWRQNNIGCPYVGTTKPCHADSCLTCIKEWALKEASNG